MKRFRYFRGKLREHPQGEWVAAKDAGLVITDALRLLSLCQFDAPEDVADLAAITKAAEGLPEV